MSTTVFERVRNIASDLFNIPREKIGPASSPENIELWDSTQHLNFILAIEEAFQLQLSPEETERIRTIGDAVAVIEEKIKAGG